LSGEVTAGRVSVLYVQALVFVVGGGNYVEYQNLVDYAKVCLALYEISRIV